MLDSQNDKKEKFKDWVRTTWVPTVVEFWTVWALILHQRFRFSLDWKYRIRSQHKNNIS